MLPTPGLTALLTAVPIQRLAWLAASQRYSLSVYSCVRCLLQICLCDSARNLLETSEPVRSRGGCRLGSAPPAPVLRFRGTWEDELTWGVGESQEIKWDGNGQIRVFVHVQQELDVGVLGAPPIEPAK